MMELSYSATALKNLVDCTNVRGDDPYSVATTKVTCGFLLKVTTAVFAALEAVSYSALLIVSTPLYFIRKKTFVDLTARTASAAKTIIDATTAISKIRAHEEKADSTPPEQKSLRQSLQDAITYAQGTVKGTFASIQKLPTKEAAAIAAGTIVILALYYHYPTILKLFQTSDGNGSSLSIKLIGDSSTDSLSGPPPEVSGICLNWPIFDKAHTNSFDPSISPIPLSNSSIEVQSSSPPETVDTSNHSFPIGTPDSEYINSKADALKRLLNISSPSNLSVSNLSIHETLSNVKVIQNATSLIVLDQGVDLVKRVGNSLLSAGVWFGEQRGLRSLISIGILVYYHQDFARYLRVVR